MSDKRMTKLDRAELLSLTIERLATPGPVPISKAAMDTTGSIEEARNRTEFGSAFARLVLYPVVVELVIKHRWEIAHGREAQHHHRILDRYNELSTGEQRTIKAVYTLCRTDHEAVIEEGRKEGIGGAKLRIAELIESLDWNARALRDLKYDMDLEQIAVPAGVFSDEETIWTLPGNVRNFAVELTRWAMKRERTGCVA